MSDLMTPEQVAEALSTSRNHVMSMARSGRLPVVKVGRKPRFEPEDIAAFRRANKRQEERATPTLAESLGRVKRSA